MKILIVEDEILILRSLKRLIERKGHEVIGTVSGKEAIGLIGSNDFDRIVCDLMLQDISGFDIIEESKIKMSSKEISDTFVIITAYSSPQVLEKAKTYGCNLIQKPFENLNEALEIITG